MKRIVRPMLRLKSLRCARKVIPGIETMPMIEKGQLHRPEGAALVAAAPPLRSERQGWHRTTFDRSSDQRCGKRPLEAVVSSDVTAGGYCRPSTVVGGGQLPGFPLPAWPGCFTSPALDERETLICSRFGPGGQCLGNSGLANV